MRCTGMDKRMTAAEVIEEVDWFSAAGVSPELIAQELKRTPTSLEKLSERNGRADLKAMFQRTHSRTAQKRATDSEWKKVNRGRETHG